MHYLEYHSGTYQLKTQTQARDERLDLRMSTEIKALVARAADMAGMTMSAFVIESIREKATWLIEQHDQITLNNEARDRLLDMLANPPEPNTKLRRAARKYQSEEII